MKEFLYDLEYLQKRGLIVGGKYLPYNPKLKERAKEMRKNLTLAERKLRVNFLQNFNKRGINKITILRQKIIDNYIVDFYIPKLSLVIEIDGETHINKKEYDFERTLVLNGYGLEEIRFSNSEIFNSFDKVCSILNNILIKNTG